MTNCQFCNGGRPMVTFDGKTWVYQDDEQAVIREIQKMNAQKEKAPKAPEKTISKTMINQGGR